MTPDVPVVGLPPAGSGAASSAPAAPAVPSEPADDVAAAVLAVPGVAGLHRGSFGEVATYLPGRKVTGVRIRDDGVTVHVVVEYGAPVLPVADAVRAAVRSLTGMSVDVTVEDVAAPPSRKP